MSNLSSEELSMTDSNEVQLFKVCPFDEILNVSKTYVCYRNEVCCPQGCCSVFTYKYFQNWHFWIIALLIFACFYMLGKYCKKLEKQRIALECNNNNNNNRLLSRNRRLAQNSRNGSTSGEDTSRASQAGGNVNNLLEHFIFQYNQNRCHQCPVPKNTTTAGEPPPLYSDALNMPKPEPKPSCTLTNECELSKSGRPHTADARLPTVPNSNEDNVPSYEDATGLARAEQREEESNCRSTLAEGTDPNQSNVTI